MNLLQDFPPRSRSTHAARSNSEGATERLSVLVVEDSRCAADILGMFFESKGHDVRVAYDGHEAVKMVMVGKPDLILMDLSMPGMNGLEAAKQIRQLNGDGTTIIALSGFDEEDDIRLCKECGFNAHIPKPVDPQELSEVLRLLV